MIPPILRRLAKRPVGATGVASEKHLSRRLTGQQTPASGALQGAKGDVTLPDVLIEAKSTITDSMSIKLDWLAKITGEARAAQKAPAVAITFTTGDGKPRRDGAWVLIPEKLFKELQE